MAEAVSTFMDVVSTMLTTITGNATLMVFFSASIVGVAVGVVKRLKRS